MNNTAREVTIAMGLALATGGLIVFALNARNDYLNAAAPQTNAPVVVGNNKTGERNGTVADLQARFDEWVKADPKRAAEIRAQIINDYGDADVDRLPVDLRLWIAELKRGR